VIEMRTVRIVGVIMGALVAVGGYVHLCLYRHGYRYIPKTGVAFLLQVVASVAVAVSLMLGPRIVARIAHLTEGATATATHLAALVLGAGTLVAFALTRTSAGLFNFRERGLQPSPQALLALLAEAAVVLLASAELFADQIRPHRQAPAVRQV
jgi:hypothetical protein